MNFSSKFRSFIARSNQAGPLVPCDIKIQGQVVAKQLDVAAEAGGSDRALVREFHNIHVENDLVLELTTSAAAENSSQWPTLCAIEVVQTDDDDSP